MNKCPKCDLPFDPEEFKFCISCAEEEQIMILLMKCTYELGRKKGLEEGKEK